MRGRDEVRAEIARRGLTKVAVERVVRVGLGPVPLTLVHRARTQLERFFSGGPWSLADDAALAGTVGPGAGWTDDPIADDIMVSFGWKGGAFKVDVAWHDDGTAETDATLTLAETRDAAPSHPRTLGDTFEDAVVMEAGRRPTEVRFLTGPGTGGATSATRTAPGDDPRVRTLFECIPGIVSIELAPGAVAVTVADAERWHDILLGLFDRVRDAFAVTRPLPPDRQLERARAELGRLRPQDTRDAAKLVDAASSPDAAFRRVAVARLEKADVAIAQVAWRAALDDPSRPVRRAAVRAIAYAERPDLRVLLEHALDDKDPCVRYYAVRGLVAIGPGPSAEAIERRRRDDDLRVRLAADAAATRRPGVAAP